MEHNARVYLAARDQKKAEAAIVDLEQATGRRALFLKLDLASLMSVKDAAKDFLAYEYLVTPCFASLNQPPVTKTSFIFCSTMRKSPRSLIGIAHVLIPASASGVMYPPRGLATADGYDLQFGVNVLGMQLHVLFSTTWNNYAHRSFLLYGASYVGFDSWNGHILRRTYACCYYFVWWGVHRRTVL